jgi:hypothetical protein
MMQHARGQEGLGPSSTLRLTGSLRSRGSFLAKDLVKQIVDGIGSNQEGPEFEDEGESDKCWTANRWLKVENIPMGKS